MRRHILIALACGAASPAFGQEAGMDHSMHGMDAAAPAPDMPADMQMDHSQMDHSMHAAQAPEQAGTSGDAADDTPGNASPPPVPADRAATAFYPPEKVDAALQGVLKEMTFRTVALQVDQLEYRARSGKDGYGFEGQAWYGGDIDRAVIAFQGEGSFGEKAESIEVDGYWRHALDPWFNLQVGVRQDFRPMPDRTYAMIGIQGLAPYWFEVDGQLFVSNKGDVHARTKASYDQRITQRLVLEPEVEADFAFQDVPELGIGAGFEKIELSARLRYEVTRMFAPYVGVFWERKLGGTADMARAAGEKASAVSALAGVRFWF